MSFHSSLATLALTVGLAGTAFGQGLEPTNLGEMRANVFTGHVLTPAPAPGADGAARILYCPSEADDAAYRAAISAAAGGATVDYFDTRAATPSTALLATYDAIYTWTNFAYFDAVGFGDRLAQASDAGKNIVLGVFCTYTTGNFLDGAIMTPAYSPVVSPTGTNHFAMSPYIGDGASCIYTAVSALDSTFRDFLTVQGSGFADGTAADGEIVHAFNLSAGPGQGSVVYSNGCGAIQLGGTGDWAIAVANAAFCNPGATPGACTFRIGTLGLNPNGYDCVSLPTAGQAWSASVDTTPTVGTSTVFTMLVLGQGGPTSGVLHSSGFEFLVNGPFQTHQANGLHNIVIPPALAGQTLYTQGVRLEADATGATSVVMLNAQDLTIG